MSKKSEKIRSSAVDSGTRNDQANKLHQTVKLKFWLARQCRLIIIYYKRLEAVYERSPAFFEQFQKNFKIYLSCDNNFAFCMHIENIHSDNNPTNQTCRSFQQILIKTMIHVQFHVCLKFQFHDPPRGKIFANKVY